MSELSSPAVTSSIGPVFVGGTGRSGTTILARLLGHHARYWRVPTEIRFHASPGGLADLLSGRVEPDWFLETLRDYWYRAPRPDGRATGLRKLCPPDRFEAAVGAFEAAFPQDRYRAAEQLVRAMLDPLAARAGKATWVEATPQTITAAPALARAFRTARFIHVVRNGLDVACSVARQPWGPATAGESLLWWEERLRESVAGSFGVEPERVLALNLESLASAERDQAYDRLLAFLDLDDDRDMRAFFTESVTSGRMHVARWTEELTAVDRRQLLPLHTHIVRGLASDGITCLSELRVDEARVPAQHGRVLNIRPRIERLKWRLWAGRPWRWRRKRWRRWARAVKRRLRGGSRSHSD